MGAGLACNISVFFRFFDAKIKRFVQSAKKNAQFLRKNLVFFN